MEADFDSPGNLTEMVHFERARFRIPGRVDWIEKTVMYLRRRAEMVGLCDDSQAARLTMALHEALTNSVIHGNLEVSSVLKEEDGNLFAQVLQERSTDPHYSSRHVDIEICYDGHCYQWQITDQGPGFNIEAAQTFDDDPDSEVSFLASGRGLMIMQSLMDDVEYQLGGRRVVLTWNRRVDVERRRHPRLDGAEPVRIAPLANGGGADWGKAYDALAREISAGGMSIFQSKHDSAERIVIEFPGEHGPFFIPATVSHLSTTEDGVIQLGCRFTPELPAEEDALPRTNPRESLEELLSVLRTKLLAHDDRREHQRVVYTERIGILDEKGEETGHAFARDLSKGGIAFISTAPMPCDELRLALPQPGGACMRIRATIVRCEAIVEGFYDVGASFIG